MYSKEALESSFVRGYILRNIQKFPVVKKYDNSVLNYLYNRLRIAEKLNVKIKLVVYHHTLHSTGEERRVKLKPLDNQTSVTPAYYCALLDKLYKRHIQFCDGFIVYDVPPEILFEFEKTAWLN